MCTINKQLTERINAAKMCIHRTRNIFCENDPELELKVDEWTFCDADLWIPLLGCQSRDAVLWMPV